jgi:hypothetical protein
MNSSIIITEVIGRSKQSMDFILNYDIKYRLGRGAGEEEDEA